MDVRLTAIRYGSRDINLYELRSLAGEALPAAAPGAHIDVHLPNGLTRQYSLLLDEAAPADPSRYVIGVKLDANSRGGSQYMHKELRVGSVLEISEPRNNFPLVETAQHTILIAGGIGVTPIWSMWNRLTAIKRQADLYYCSRTRGDAVFADDLAGNPRVFLSFDDENAGAFLDIAGIVQRAPHHAHLYCCGPLPMLQAFEDATKDWPSEQVHIEYFSSSNEEPPATEGGFEVELARSKRVVQVGPGQTILEALIEAGVDAEYSCEEGVCGACMTGVVSGTPDHRDSVMTPGERAENKKIMICCSGSKSSRLVLDL